MLVSRLPAGRVIDPWRKAAGLHSWLGGPCQWHASGINNRPGVPALSSQPLAGRTFPQSHQRQVWRTMPVVSATMGEAHDPGPIPSISVLHRDMGFPLNLEVLHHSTKQQQGFPNFCKRAMCTVRSVITQCLSTKSKPNRSHLPSAPRTRSIPTDPVFRSPVPLYRSFEWTEC